MNFIPIFILGSLSLGSTGPAKSTVPYILGSYVLASQKHNGYPVYKKDDGHYIYFQKVWYISNTLGANGGFAGNLDRSYKPPISGWQYVKQGKWKTDDATLKLSGI